MIAFATLLSAASLVPPTGVRHASPRMQATVLSDELQSALDSLPVFTVANGEGQPLQYQIGQQKGAVFYADVDAAKTQLAAESKAYPDLECDLINVGLGSAYKLAAENKGLIVPGIEQLVAAGAPEDANPMGQELPLFACLSMSRENENELKLFMSHADCAAEVANDDACATENGCEILPFPLSSVVQDSGSAAFKFAAPSSSLQHTQSYLGKGVYFRKVDDDEE